jgi:broad specificity phosphatase PhoE
MKKYLIMVKHSLPEIVENLPAREWRLSNEGRIRAEKLADRLRGYHPEIIASSVEPKAMETAEIIAGKHGLAVHVFEGLHEHERDTVPFLSRDQFERAVLEFFEKPDQIVFGSESADQSRKRFERAVNSVLETHGDKTLVIVAHGTVISLFVSHLMGSPGFLLWKELGLPSFVVIDMQANTLIDKENIV